MVYNKNDFSGRPRAKSPAGTGKEARIVPGTLYIVATPIGNLDDLTPRAAATFGAADFIAAEDTRVTLRLLNHLGLKKPLVSYYEHALFHGEAILQRIAAGESCALCSDAGMPCVSDPGEAIVRDAIARGIPVVPVPAASAAVTALSVSGQKTDRWVFEGFLPVEKKPRRARLDELLHETRTIILYEAPHKLRATLADLCEAFGPARSVTLCRELTKLHEEVRKTTLGEARALYEAAEPRGEYVLVLAGAAPADAAAADTLAGVTAHARALMETEGLPPSAAAREAARGTPFPKSSIYRALLDGADTEDNAT
jgi:16S rRNA (cytidine1402-2'-O)-methyltransferase